MFVEKKNISIVYIKPCVFLQLKKRVREKREKKGKEKKDEEGKRELLTGHYQKREKKDKEEREEFSKEGEKDTD